MQQFVPVLLLIPLDLQYAEERPFLVQNNIIMERSRIAGGKQDRSQSEAKTKRARDTPITQQEREPAGYQSHQLLGWDIDQATYRLNAVEQRWRQARENRRFLTGRRRKPDQPQSNKSQEEGPGQVVAYPAVGPEVSPVPSPPLHL